MAEDTSSTYELYLTTDGTIQVSSEVKLQILHELSDSNLSLTELAKRTGKAQSTISVHLDRMVEDKLITVHDDLSDCRKKYYTIIAIPFAKSKAPAKDSRDLLIKTLSEAAQNPEEIRKAAAKLIFLGFDGAGMDITPLSNVIGFILGAAISDKLIGKDIVDTTSNIRDYLMKFGVVEINVFSLEPLTIIAKNGSSYTEGSAVISGGFLEGFFCKVLEDATGKQYQVTLREVFGTESNYFRFVLEPKQIF